MIRKIRAKSPFVQDGDGMWFHRILLLEWMDENGRTIQFSTCEHFTSNPADKEFENTVSGHYFMRTRLDQEMLDDFNQRVEKMLEYIPRFNMVEPGIVQYKFGAMTIQQAVH